MLAISDNSQVLRNRIKEDLVILDMDELKELSQTIVAMAAEKAIKSAGRDWEEKKLSREKIRDEVENQSQSKNTSEFFPITFYSLNFPLQNLRFF
jgi:hypothetical protein